MLHICECAYEYEHVNMYAYENQFSMLVRVYVDITCKCLVRTDLSQVDSGYWSPAVEDCTFSNAS